MTAEAQEAVVGPGAPGTSDDDLRQALEAVLMVADDPQTSVSLATAVARPVREVEAALAALRDDLDGAGGSPRRGFELRRVGGGWRFYVREAHDALVRDFVLTQNPTRLSQAALETLAVIAYKQPVSRSAVAQVRAVNVDGVVRTLVGRGLVTEAGTDPETGALLYQTTELLLTHLGIDSLDELPHLSPLLSDGREGTDHVA